MKTDVFDLLPINTIKTNKMLKELPQYNFFSEIISNFTVTYTIRIADVSHADFQASLRKYEQNSYNQSVQEAVNMAKTAFIYIYQHLSTYFGVDDFIQHYRKILYTLLRSYNIPTSYIEKNAHKSYNELIRSVKSHIANTWIQKNVVLENVEVLIQYIIQAFFRQYVDDTFTLADIFAMPLVDMKYNRLEGFHTKAMHLCSYYSMFMHEPSVHQYYSFLFDAYMRYTPQCYIKKFDLYKPAYEDVATQLITEKENQDIISEEQVQTPAIQDEAELLIKQVQDDKIDRKSVV